VISLAVLISGSGSNLRSLLEATAAPDSPVRIIAVGADVDAAGLGHAREFGVETFVVSPRKFDSREAWGQALLASVQATGADLVVCAGFMRILPANFVQALTPNLINMHPALLPLYPGAHAVRDALAGGATETGATVHVVDEGVDTGPVIRQVALEIEPGETEEHLHERIKTIERKLIVDTVFDIAHNRINLKELARS
jgi:phosphoribosylglycinamide formyltransferase-1